MSWDLCGGGVRVVTRRHPLFEILTHCTMKMRSCIASEASTAAARKAHLFEREIVAYSPCYSINA